MSKPGSLHEAIDNDRNGEATLLKSKGKLEQKDRSKRAKEIDGDTKDKVFLDRHSNGHGDHSRLFGATDPVSIRAYAPGGPVSRSSRPQPPFLSPKEINTCDDVSVDRTRDVFKVKTAEGSDETPSTHIDTSDIYIPYK